MADRVRENPEKVKERGKIVEHPFGTIKQAMNQGYFLTRGIESVTGEMSLTMLAYDIKRVLNIFGTQNLIKAMRMVMIREKSSLNEQKYFYFAFNQFLATIILIFRVIISFREEKLIICNAA